MAKAGVRGAEVIVARADRAVPNIDTAKEWLPACKAYIGEWWTFVRPWSQGKRGLRRMSNALGCIDVPSSVTRRQSVQVVVRYIETRPQRMDESFFQLAFEALHVSWPCSGGK